MTDTLFSDNPYVNRRTFLKWAGSALVATVLGVGIASMDKDRPSGRYKKISRPNTRNDVSGLGYYPHVEEPDLRVSIADINSVEGRIQRASRWQNITNTVEQVYGIPKDYLTGMICVESMGDPTMPNSSGDGGLGLIHMQPVNARKYGLEMITDSDRLIDRYQGRKIFQAIDLHNGDLRELIEVDDRFHPVKNIDAAGRMLRELYQKTGSWTGALERFAGRGNYDSNVLRYVDVFRSKSLMKRVADDFDSKNKHNHFEGQPLTFDRYVALFHELNINYGIDAYKRIKGINDFAI